jgi:hypothetical protein
MYLKGIDMYKVRQANFLFWTERSEAYGRPRRVGVVSFKRGDPTVMWRCGSVAIMRWSNEQRAFAVEAYFSKTEASLLHPVY